MQPRLDWAQPEDAPGIAALVAQPPPGRVRFAFAETTATLADEDSIRHQAIVMRGQNGEVLAHGARTTRRLRINGKESWVGYLHGLRRHESLAGDGRSLAAGLARLIASRQHDECEHDFTAILSDNHRARRVLEGGIPGAPPYHLLCDYRTLVVSDAFVRRSNEAGITVRPCPAEALREVQDMVDRSAPDYASVALVTDDFLTAWCGDKLVGAVSMIDHGDRRIAEISGYSPLLTLTRVAVNAALRITGRPTLPRAPARMKLAYAAHLTVPDEDRAVVHALLAGAALRSPKKTHLVLGFGAGHPLASICQRLPAWRFHSRIYAVGAMPAASSRPISPEAAWL